MRVFRRRLRRSFTRTGQRSRPRDQDAGLFITALRLLQPYSKQERVLIAMQDVINVRSYKMTNHDTRTSHIDRHAQIYSFFFFFPHRNPMCSSRSHQQIESFMRY